MHRGRPVRAKAVHGSISFAEMVQKAVHGSISFAEMAQIMLQNSNLFFPAKETKDFLAGFFKKISI